MGCNYVDRLNSFLLSIQITILSTQITILSAQITILSIQITIVSIQTTVLFLQITKGDSFISNTIHQHPTKITEIISDR